MTRYEILLEIPPPAPSPIEQIWQAEAKLIREGYDDCPDLRGETVMTQAVMVFNKIPKGDLWPL